MRLKQTWGIGVRNAKSTRKSKGDIYARFLCPVRIDGRKTPGWKMVKAKQARAIIL
jgi:hypothetical protein